MTAPSFGGCVNYGPTVRIHFAATEHFPHCEPRDCYCGVTWRDCDRERKPHDFQQTTAGRSVCTYCKVDRIT